MKQDKFEERLAFMLEKYDAIADKISNVSSLSQSDFIKLSKEYSNMGDIVDVIKERQTIKKNILDLELMLEDPDKDIVEMAQLEKQQNITLLEGVDLKIKMLLLPKDTEDEKNAIVEIRAGTGGDEAALFASTLFLISF